jgi:glycerol-3-phosphate dehydrogenase (NAD(P)+)
MTFRFGPGTTVGAMAERVTILGDGAMATVCSILLTQNGHDVTMWGAFEESIERLIQDREQRRLLPGVSVPQNVRLTANDSESFAGASMILSAIPTQFMRGVWERLRPHVPAGVSIVSVAKGIETTSLLRPTQVIADVLWGRQAEVGRDGVGSDGVETSSPRHAVTPSRRHDLLAALSGPNIAGEIARYLPATAVAASSDPELVQRVQVTFATDWFRVYTNDDVIGVEVAGAVKNVIALAAGILDGLGAGNNAKAALVTRGLVEIARLGAAMGAKEDTFNGLAGVGDLITTCVSPEGRNRRVGEQIGKGRKLQEILDQMDSVAEGVPTTKAVKELARRYDVAMPITDAVYSVLFEEKDVLTALTELMTRDPKPERADEPRPAQ